MDNQIHNFIIQPRRDRPVFTDAEILANFRERFKGGTKAMSKKEEILNAITNSFPNAITRSELMVLTGLCDRIVRVNISKLRHKDNWILSCPNKPGYWLTKDAREWDAFVDDWNQSNRFNMLKKSNKSEFQWEIKTDEHSLSMCGSGGGGR